MNWDNKIEKIEKLIKSWKPRKLTMIGRIQIVKSLLIPQLIYNISVLSMPKDVIKKIESALFRYIWDGKSEKVKRKTLIRHYHNGGLKMIDICSLIKTIQSKWVIKLLDSDKAQWKTIPLYYFNKFGENLLIFEMNLDTIKSLPNLADIPLFYQDVLDACISIGGGQQNTPVKEIDIAKQLIWGNKFIKSKNKVLIFPDWINCGIITLQDILDHNGYISENVVLTKLNNKRNWIAELAIIKKSIPCRWQHQLKNSEVHKYQTNRKMLVKINQHLSVQIDKLTNKIIYTNLVDKYSESPIGFTYWVNELNIEKTYIYKCLPFIFNDLDDNKLKVFRWKLLNKILPTKVHLYKWKITPNPLCNSCGQVENYYHFFIECEYIQNFKTKINQLLNHLGYNKEMITLKNIVVGYKIQDTQYKPINYLLTVIGYTIYKTY